MMRTLLALCCLALLSGCAHPVTSMKLDANGNPVVVTEQKGFFASENLDTYYNAEAVKAHEHRLAVEKKLDAIQANSSKRMGLAMTSNEATLANIIDSLLISQIKEDAPVTAPPPKTMVDYLGPQAVPLLQLGLGAVGAFTGNGYLGGVGSGGDTYNIDHTNIGGDFASKAVIHKDQNPYVEAGATYSPSQSPTFNIPYTTTDSHDTSSRNTDSHNSLPVTP